MHCTVMADSGDAPTAARLSHLNARGEVHMVDVAERASTARSATAEGFIRITPSVLQQVLSGQAAKGDVLAVSRVAAGAWEGLGARASDGG